jgi:hypothetical protein
MAERLFELRVTVSGDSEVIGIDEHRISGEAHEVLNARLNGTWSTRPLTVSGYRNYETFCVANYVSGNYDGQPTYKAARTVVTGCVGDDYAKAREIRLWVENRLPELDGLGGDLLAGAIEECDWREIVAHVTAD